MRVKGLAAIRPQGFRYRQRLDLRITLNRAVQLPQERPPFRSKCSQAFSPSRITGTSASRPPARIPRQFSAPDPGNEPTRPAGSMRAYTNPIRSLR